MNKTLYNLATVAGILVGVISYLHTAFLLFWEENGEALTTRACELFDHLTEAIRLTYLLGKDTGAWCRNTAQPALVRVIDSIYYRTIDS